MLLEHLVEFAVVAGLGGGFKVSCGYPPVELPLVELEAPENNRIMIYYLLYKSKYIRNNVNN